MTVTDEMVRAGIAAMLAAIYDDLPADMTLEEGQPHAMRSALEAAFEKYQPTRDAMIDDMQSQIAALRSALRRLEQAQYPVAPKAGESRWCTSERWAEERTQAGYQARHALSKSNQTAKDHDDRIRADALEEAAKMAETNAERIQKNAKDFTRTAYAYEKLADRAKECRNIAHDIRKLCNREDN